MTGGCPQGSILGVFLFNATIDDLEDPAPGMDDDTPGSSEDDSVETVPPVPCRRPGPTVEISQLETAGPSSTSPGILRAEPDTSPTVCQPTEASPQHNGVGPSTLAPQGAERYPSVMGSQPAASSSQKQHGLGPSTSTPRAPGCEPLQAVYSDLKVGLRVGDAVELLPNLREDHRRCLFSTPAPDPLLPEPNTRTQAKWKDRDIKLYKYLDDAICCDRVSMDSANRFEGGECSARELLATQTQNLFRQVTGKAEWKGMVVNLSLIHI